MYAVVLFFFLPLTWISLLSLHHCFLIIIFVIYPKNICLHSFHSSWDIPLLFQWSSVCLLAPATNSCSNLILSLFLYPFLWLLLSPPSFFLSWCTSSSLHLPWLLPCFHLHLFVLLCLPFYFFITLISPLLLLSSYLFPVLCPLI